MFLIIGFCTMLLFYLVAITTLVVITFKQGLQDRKIVDVTNMVHE